MIAIATELIDLLKTALALASKKAELDKQYFEQFIQPAWEAFRRVHEDYKASFNAYIESISSDDCDVKQLMDRIRSDAIQTNDLRVDLVRIVTNLPSARLKTKGEYLNNFVLDIAEYLNIEPTRPPLSPFNPSRFQAVNYISQKSHTRSESKEYLEKIRIGLQIKYDRVTSSYHKLRTSLLM